MNLPTEQCCPCCGAMYVGTVDELCPDCEAKIATLPQVDTPTLLEEAALDFIRRKYVARENRGILYVEAAQDDLAKEIARFMRSYFAAFADPDVAGLVARLEWEGPLHGWGIGDMYQAPVLNGMTGYRIADRLTTGKRRFHVTICKANKNHVGSAPTLEKAKAVAERDFAERISAYVTTALADMQAENKRLWDLVAERNGQIYSRDVLWSQQYLEKKELKDRAAALEGALRDLADAARSACDARKHIPLIEALDNADRLLLGSVSGNEI